MHFVTTTAKTLPYRFKSGFTLIQIKKQVVNFAYILSIVVTGIQLKRMSFLTITNEEPKQ
ncbi:hypothetical protein COR52_17790 [Vibrio mediterranei]|nr:hypothetical protein COR52_17790 [Vibrio mediterranei]